MNTQALLQPYTMHDLTLRNRVIMAPLTRSRANNPTWSPTDLHVDYYTQRASAGIIITEGAPVSPMAIGYMYTPGIYNDAQKKGWEKVVKAVHKQGGCIFMQLWHVGRVSHPSFLGGRLPLAPSALHPGGKAFTATGAQERVMPQAMTLADIQATIQDFTAAAISAFNIGFDGVEIHSSNGYLFHQFFNDSSNQRTDAYGGSIENRARLLFELLDNLEGKVPLNRVGLRFNPSMHTRSLALTKTTIPTFDYIINKLNDYPVAYVHVSEPFSPVDDVPFAEPNITQRYRKIYKGTLMTNNNFTQKSGNAIIEAGTADLVAYGRYYISNPDLPARFAQHAPLTPPDRSTFYTPGPKGYTDYPNWAGV
jgi:N-ethylmaleimide reductase